MVSSKCLNDRELQKLVHSHITLQEQRGFEEHLESCGSCRDRLDKLAGQIAVPETLGTDLHSQASTELSRVMDRLEKMEGPRESKAVASRYLFLSPTSRPEGLGRLGKYEVLHVLGEGGMAVVFAAWDPSLNREVAIKVPSRWLIDTSESCLLYTSDAADEREV